MSVNAYSYIYERTESQARIIYFIFFSQEAIIFFQICDISGLITALRENLDTMDLAAEERALLFPGEDRCKVSAVGL